MLISMRLARRDFFLVFVFTSAASVVASFPAHMLEANPPASFFPSREVSAFSALWLCSRSLGSMFNLSVLPIVFWVSVSGFGPS